MRRRPEYAIEVYGSPVALFECWMNTTSGTATNIKQVLLDVSELGTLKHTCIDCEEKVMYLQNNLRKLDDASVCM